jgi:hypothetical protein
MTRSGARPAGPEALVGDLIRPNYQLKRIAASPVASGVRRLAGEVAPVPEAGDIS